MKRLTVLALASGLAIALVSCGGPSSPAAPATPTTPGKYVLYQDSTVIVSADKAISGLTVKPVPNPPAAPNLGPVYDINAPTQLTVPVYLTFKSLKLGSNQYLDPVTYDPTTKTWVPDGLATGGDTIEVPHHSLWSFVTRLFGGLYQSSAQTFPLSATKGAYLPPLGSGNAGGSPAMVTTLEDHHYDAIDPNCGGFKYASGSSNNLTPYFYKPTEASAFTGLARTCWLSLNDAAFQALEQNTANPTPNTTFDDKVAYFSTLLSGPVNALVTNDLQPNGIGAVQLDFESFHSAAGGFVDGTDAEAALVAAIPLFEAQSITVDIALPEWVTPSDHKGTTVSERYLRQMYGEGPVSFTFMAYNLGSSDANGIRKNVDHMREMVAAATGGNAQFAIAAPYYAHANGSVENLSTYADALTHYTHLQDLNGALVYLYDQIGSDDTTPQSYVTTYSSTPLYSPTDYNHFDSLFASGSATPPHITTFTATPNKITPGGSTTFDWAVTGAHNTLTCTLDPGDGSAPITVNDCANTTSQPHTYSSAAGSPYTATLTIEGTGAKSTTDVTVQTSTGTTVNVTQQGTVPWIAWQDGTGAWQTLNGSSFTVTDAAGRYGVAYACTVNSASLVEVFQATTNDSTTATVSCQVTIPTYYTYSGTVSGLPPGGNGHAIVSIGTCSTGTDQGTTVTYSEGCVPAGTDTAVVYSFDGSGNPGAMVVQPNIDVTGNAALDFDLSSGQPFTLNSVQATGVPSGEGSQLNAWLQPRGIPLTGSNGDTFDYPSIPPSLLPSGSIYALTVNAATTPSNGNWSQQGVSLWTANPSTNLSVALPSAMPSGAGLSVTGGTATVTWEPVTFPTTGGSTVYNMILLDGPVGDWVVFATKDWLGTASSYTYPDFTATANWNAAWELPTNESSEVLLNEMHLNLAWQQAQPQLLAGAFATGEASSLPDGSRAESAGVVLNGTY